MFQVSSGRVVHHGGAREPLMLQSVAPGVRLSVHLSGLKTKELSHRDVWQRVLSHSTASEVFIRLFSLNWRKEAAFV